MGTIRKQGIYNTIFAYLGVLIGFVNILVLQPEWLTAEQLGLVRMLFSTSIILGTLYPLGLNGVIVRFFPQFRNKEQGNYGFINLVFLIVIGSYLVFAAAIYFFRNEIFEGYNKSPLFIQYFNYIFPMTLFAGLVSMANAYASIIFKSTISAFLDEVFNRFYQVIILCLFFLEIISFGTFVTLFMLMYAIQFSILAFYLSAKDKLTTRIDWPFMRKQNWREILNFTVVIALASLASRSLRQLDIVMLGSNLSAGIPLEEVAVYTIAATIGAIVEVPANALSKIADSKVSDALHRNDLKLVQTVYSKSARFLSVLGGLFFLGVVINIHSLLSLIGGKYVNGETVVIIMAGSAFFNMATGLNNSIIFYSKYYRWGSALVIAMVIMSFGLNYWLIPLYGITGAAIATASTFVFYNVVKFLIIWFSFRLQPFGKFVPVVVILTGICLGVNYFLPAADNKYLDILYRSVLVTGIYIAGIIFSKVIPGLNSFFKKGEKRSLFEFLQ